MHRQVHVNEFLMHPEKSGPMNTELGKTLVSNFQNLDPTQNLNLYENHLCNFHISLVQS